MHPARKARHGAPLEQGDRVKVIGHVGGNLDDGRSFDLRGEEARVIGANPHYRRDKTGERMTTLELGNGAVVSVPTRAIKRD